MERSCQSQQPQGTTAVTGARATGSGPVEPVPLTGFKLFGRMTSCTHLPFPPSSPFSNVPLTVVQVTRLQRMASAPLAKLNTLGSRERVVESAGTLFGSADGGGGAGKEDDEDEDEDEDGYEDDEHEGDDEDEYTGEEDDHHDEEGTLTKLWERRMVQMVADNNIKRVEMQNLRLSAFPVGLLLLEDRSSLTTSVSTICSSSERRHRRG